MICQSVFRLASQVRPLPIFLRLRFCHEGLCSLLAAVATAPASIRFGFFSLLLCGVSPESPRRPRLGHPPGRCVYRLRRRQTPPQNLVPWGRCGEWLRHPTYSSIVGWEVLTSVAG